MKPIETSQSRDELLPAFMAPATGADSDSRQEFAPIGVRFSHRQDFESGAPMSFYREGEATDGPLGLHYSIDPDTVATPLHAGGGTLNYTNSIVHDPEDTNIDGKTVTDLVPKWQVDDANND